MLWGICLLCHVFINDWLLIDNLKCEVFDINNNDKIGKMCEGEGEGEVAVFSSNCWDR